MDLFILFKIKKKKKKRKNNNKGSSSEGASRSTLAGGRKSKAKQSWRWGYGCSYGYGYSRSRPEPRPARGGVGAPKLPEKQILATENGKLGEEGGGVSSYSDQGWEEAERPLGTDSLAEPGCALKPGAA